MHKSWFYDINLTIHLKTKHENHKHQPKYWSTLTASTYKTVTNIYNNKKFEEQTQQGNWLSLG